MADEERERGFKVEDRRRFTETGEARPGTPEQEKAPGNDARPASAAGPAAGEESPAAEISFASFLIGLSTQALVALGEVPNPVDGGVAVDLETARQIIDILGILREKTKGNLDDAETALLDHALYDLRMRFVERKRPPA